MLKNKYNCVIITNNPLVLKYMSGAYEVKYSKKTYREILVQVRDMVYSGHRLYTHPLAGSVKPNESPYRSVAVSAKSGEFSMDEAEIISNGIITFDKFAPRKIEITEQADKDFQLVDYTLICGALGFDPINGLSVNI